MFWDRVECFSSTSSFGIPYWLLYSPVAIILLLQIIFDKWVTWFLFSALSIGLSWTMIFEELDWDRNRTDAKGGPMPEFKMITDVLWIAIPCLLFLAILYFIMPQFKKHSQENIN